MLDKLLVEAGIERRQVYLTNAVKHFKFTLREVLGRVFATELCESTIATYHPSALLRAMSGGSNAALKDPLVEDLQRANTIATGN